MTSRYNWLRQLQHRIMSYKWMTAILAKCFPTIDRVVFKLTGGRYSAASILASLPLVMVHAVGAKSGLPRPTPLLCIRDNNNDIEFAVIASNFGNNRLPAWYHNLKAHPQVECTIRGKTATYLASEASGEDYRYYWAIANQIYPGYAAYHLRAGRHLPIIIMTPIL